MFGSATFFASDKLQFSVAAFTTPDRAVASFGRLAFLEQHIFFLVDLSL